MTIQYRNQEKLKLILMAIRENSEANGRMVNMAWQELDKPVKPVKEKAVDRRRVNSATNPTLRVLQSKTYPISANYIAKKTGMKAKAIQHNIWRLRSYGYNIETSYHRSRKAKYRLIVAA
jgi:biotin operon repressor